MYANFYGFRENPFSLLPDPDFLYLSAQHEHALNLLQLAAINHSGFCAISGAPGTGKSTLIRALLSSLDDEVCTGLITDTYSSFSELLKRILIAFDLDCAESDDVSRYKRFTDFVIHKYAAGQNVLLIVDEAQNLSHGVMEQLRMLSNINADKNPMIQIMLIGQESLQDKLKSPLLKQLAQRIECNHQLLPLEANDTRAYIRHRVSKAGGSAELFDDSACKLIHEKSGGIPRIINRICDLALVYGYAADKHDISAEIVAAAAIEQFASESDSQTARRDTLVPAPSAAAKPPASRPRVPKKQRVKAAPILTRTSAGNSTTNSIKPVEPPAQPVNINDTSDADVVAETGEKVASDDLSNKQDAMAAASAQKAAAIVKLKEAIETAQYATQQSESLNIAAQRAHTKHAKAKQKLSEQTEHCDRAIQQLESDQTGVEKLSAEKANAEQSVVKLEKFTAATRQRTRDQETAIAQQLKETQLAEQQALAAAKAAAMEAEKALQERIAAERVAADILSEAESAAEQARKTLLETESQAAEQTTALKAEAQQAVTEQQLANEAAQQKADELNLARATVDLAADRALRLTAEKDETTATVEQQARIMREIGEQAAQAETEARQAEEAQQHAEQHAATQVTAEKLLAAELADDLARIARQEADRAAASKAAALRTAQEKEDLARTAAEQAAKAKAEADKAAGAEIRILMDEEEDSAAPATPIPEIPQEELNTVTRLAAEARLRQKKKSNWSLIAASAAGILLISWITLEMKKPDATDNVKIPGQTEAAALEILPRDATSEN